jgi:nitrile hydratase
MLDTIERVSSDPNMKDFEAHVAALEADVEYWRVKRCEPRMLHFVRRNIVPLHALFATAGRMGANGVDKPILTRSNGEAREEEHDDEHDHEHEALEERIRSLEDRLDDYVRAIALSATEPGKVDFVIDDSRKESGAYDPFFKFTKRMHGGSLEKRLEQLDRELRQNMLVLETFTRCLIENGLLSEETVAKRRAQQAKNGAKNGARIVARAWVDPEFKEKLKANGREAVRELDIPPGLLAKLGVAENTDSVHNVVVCTLCSCYPRDLFGDPPWWYRHDSYKQQIVQDPRGVLAEMFGLQVPEEVTIQVHDSTADLRWMVLPQRPAGTEGWSEEELAELVTIESLVGVSRPAISLK